MYENNNYLTEGSSGRRNRVRKKFCFPSFIFFSFLNLSMVIDIGVPVVFCRLFFFFLNLKDKK